MIKNKKLHQILAYTFVVAVLATMVSIIYNQQVTQGLKYSNSNPIKHIEVAKEKYTDTQGKFQIEYPKTYLFSNFLLTEGSDFLVRARPLKSYGTRITIPASLYAGTNFIEAYLSISVSPDSTEVDCKKYLDNVGGKASFDVMERMNSGLNFYVAGLSGVAAGNIYENRIYHTWHDKTCYEVVLTLHTGNIANYMPGKTLEIDKEEVWGRLNVILNTLRFTDDAR